MTPEELQAWMKNLNTQMLELILTVGAGGEQWYKDAMTAEIQRRKAARPSFTCPDCHRTSYNPNDIRERYCGNCHEWKGQKSEGNSRDFPSDLHPNAEEPSPP